MSQAVSLSESTWFQRTRESMAAKPVRWFLLFWFGLNFLQVSFMELTSDEGYYWFYAQHLQWGYYDHPPMIAALIKLGGFLFPGELGVRAFNVVLSTVALALFFSLLPESDKTKRRTYFVLLSAPLLHYLTFLVFPDGPLLTFSLLFLVLYKRFLQTKTVGASLLLGLSLALMAYAKYHGALVLLFSVLANPRLLKSGYFYLSLLVAALLFLPHLWWQYQHHFPTLTYHLSGRTGQWSFRHVGEYLSQQIVAIGPGLIFVPFVCRASDVFERTLKFIIIGTFLFFLISSFKTFVHFHWTSIALYPLLYFAVRYYNQPGKTKLFRWLILPLVVLFFMARLLLAVPIIQSMHVGEDVYHGRKGWAKEVAALAGEAPVFMPNNLREASLYSFYSGKQGVTLYNRPEKKSQYELWGYEDSLQGKDVLFVTKYPHPGGHELQTGIGQKLYYSRLPAFSSFYTGVAIFASANKRTGDSLFVTLSLQNNRRAPLGFALLNGEPVSLVSSVEKGKDVVSADVVRTLSDQATIPPGGIARFAIALPLRGLASGDYRIHFGIRNGVLPDAVLSNPLAIQVR